MLAVEVVMRAVVLVVVMLAGGCVSPSWSRMDEESKADWRVCAQAVSREQCGGGAPDYSRNGVADPYSCIRRHIDDYGNASQKHRRWWLIRNGCPRDMVDPNHSAAKKADGEDEEDENAFGFSRQ